MRKPLLIATSAVLSVIAGSIGVASGLSTKSVKDNDYTVYGNDPIHLEFKPGYQEVFKKDTHSGDQNYLYTVTSYVDAFGRDCTTTTGASERTISTDCDFPPAK